MAREYKVQWVIELDADSPEHAVRLAEEWMRDDGGFVYQVTNTKTGESVEIDTAEV